MTTTENIRLDRATLRSIPWSISALGVVSVLAFLAGATFTWRPWPLSRL